MTRRHVKTAAIIFCAALFAASPAEANAIVPSMFGAVGMAMVVMLVPIIIIESLVAGLYLGLSTWTAIKVVAIGNLASTVVGIPMTRIVLGTARAIGGRHTERFFGPMFEIPTEDWDDLDESDEFPDQLSTRETLWLEGFGISLVFALFFLASWGIEYWIAAAIVDELSPPVVADGVLVANVATYGMIGAALLVAFLREWNERRREAWGPGHDRPTNSPAAVTESKQ